MKALARLIAGVAVAGCLSLPALAAAGQPSVRVQDLDNRPTDPFQASRDANVIVFLFTSVDCPISNRYAPEVQRLYGAFRSKGVEFWLVYPNPSESADAIRKHMEAFSYPMRVLRDPQHALAKLAHATVTPEAAVYDVARRLVYRGRI